MERQCAGCGKVFEDGKEPAGLASPRPYGCCDDCNKASFKHKVHTFEDGKCTTCDVKEEDHKAFLASQANKPPMNPTPAPTVEKLSPKKAVAS